MIYVASPYTDKNPGLMHERYRAVCTFCASAVLKGYSVFSPIAHWHPIAVEYGLPKDAIWWRSLNRDYLRNSEKLWILKLVGWKESTGIQGEILFARNIRLPITFMKEGEILCMK